LVVPRGHATEYQASGRKGGQTGPLGKKEKHFRGPETRTGVKGGEAGTSPSSRKDVALENHLKPGRHATRNIKTYIETFLLAKGAEKFQSDTGKGATHPLRTKREKKGPWGGRKTDLPRKGGKKNWKKQKGDGERGGLKKKGPSGP